MTGYHTGHGTLRGNPTWTVSGQAVDLTPQDQTVAKELKRAGYHTGIVGKWGLSESNLDGMPTRQGFDYFYGYRSHYDAHYHYWPSLWRNESIVHIDGNDYLNTEGKYVHDLVTEEALKYIEDHQKDPFFLYVAFALPHYELTVPEDSKEPYKDLGWPVEPREKAHYRDDADGNIAYAGMVSRLDRDVGRILDHLKSLGLEENTLVIFTSDNGPVYERKDRFFNSNGPLRGGKRDLYEGGIRVPMIAHWPGKIKAGSVSNHPSAFWDFLPTACELAGIKPSDRSIDGISYLPTLFGKGKQKEHDVLYWELNEGEGPIQAVRVGDMKAVKYMGKSIELYDLSNDISETNNLAESSQKEAARLEKILAGTRTHSEEFPLTRRKNHGKL
jgi:arylsulfatase A-like enzyme